VAARNFSWTALGGGAWDLAANWDDQTDGVDPSTLVPGSQDSVTVPGPTGTATEAISGGGAVAAALFTGNSILSGTYAVGTLAIGQGASSGMLQLAPGAALATGVATLSAGSLIVNGTGSSFTAQGNFGLGNLATGLSAALEATGGGSASLLGLALAASNAALYVDPQSAILIGTLGGAALGALTIDPGFSVSGQGDANQYGATVNDGTIAALGGTLGVGTLTGTGLLSIGADATLALYGPCGAGQSVAFAGANGTLTIRAEFYAPLGTLTGFAAGDALDVAGSNISSATYSQTGQGLGKLTLWYGSQAADVITLAGTYAGDVFLTAGDGDLGTLITLAPSSGGGGSPSPGTSTPDAYLWVAAGSGTWKRAANWKDVTTGADPAAIAPGIHNTDTIAAAQSSFTVIGGPANAASLALTGEVALSGTYAIGTLSVGAVSGSNFTDGTLDFLPGTSITTTSTSIASGAISVTGSGSTLSVGGTLDLGGGIAGVGLPVTALTVSAGASVSAGTLLIGGGSGNTIVTDPVSSLEIGTLGGAMLGAVTVDPGAEIVGNGAINPLGSIIDNGRILATDGVLTLGSVTGTGALYVTDGTLALNYATAVPIVFYGQDAVLAVAGEDALPTSTLTDFAPTDVIDVMGDPITSATYTANANHTGGTLTLAYDGTVVGTLSLVGAYSDPVFVCVPDGSTGTDIEQTKQGSGGGGGGQTGTDQLVWTGAANTDWSNPANWYDRTTGSVATAPPGAQTPAIVAGLTGTHLGSIGGTGSCASLVFTGNFDLQAKLATGTLTLGSDASGSLTAVEATISLGTAATLSANSAFVADGGLIVGSGASFTVTGTLALGDGTETPIFSLQGGGTAQLGALSLGGGSISVDTASVLEIGTRGGVQAGTLAVDAAHAVTGYGLLNVFGATEDAGTISALGGTLTLGAVGGSGLLEAATESTLALDASCSTAISFAGAGATLMLLDPDAYPVAAISGLAEGDSIVIASSQVQSVIYTPGTGTSGTLTLTDDGQTLGTLLLDGSYGSDTFSVQPDGTGSEITFVPTVYTGPPPGTTTPDDYVWTGADSTQWSQSGNWQDTTASQDPAAVPPGQNDLVTIAAGAAPLAITGPANAASLALTGTVSLAGTYGIGTLAIGSAATTGVLALASGDAISAVDVAALGGIEGQGGSLVASGTLSLGNGTVGGAVIATGQTSIIAQFVTLSGTASALETDSAASIAIGALAAAQPGAVVVGADGALSGNGAVNPSGDVVDDGQIAASGGTLLLGTVSGTGTLLIDPGATLYASGAAGLTADFTGAGTLSLGAASAPGIADFGPSDAIILPVSDATSASYTLVAPGVGIITILNGTAPLATLTLDGSVSSELFTVAAAPGGGTVLTASAANMAGTGGETVSSNSLSVGENALATGDFLSWVQEYLPYAQTYLQDLIDQPGNPQTAYLWGLDGASVPGVYNSFGFNMEVVAPSSVADGGGSSYILQPGYKALAALGSEPVDMFDNSVGSALLVGNANANPDIPDILVANNVSNDTLVGGPGGNTAFWADYGNVSVVGGGNDTINISTANGAVTTASGYRSRVYLKGSDSHVVSLGADYVITACNGATPVDDVVSVGGPAGGPGATVFGALHGLVSVTGGQSYAWAVGNGGEVILNGGASSGNLLFGGLSNAEYFGGAGSGIVVGGVGPDSPSLLYEGGSGATTIFGGNGNNYIQGGSGPEVMIVGLGPTTIQATAGNTIWLMSSAPVQVYGTGGIALFAGGSTGNDAFYTNGGSETLFGGAGPENFYIGNGQDTLVCGSGQEVFNFTNGISGGSDTIYSFQPGLDAIHLQGFGNTVPNLTYSGGNTLFTLSNGTSVEIYHVTANASSFTST
jgi:hypothetical protein